MELLNQKEFEAYIRGNYEIILSNDSSQINTEVANKCDFCKRDIYLKIGSRWLKNNYHGDLPNFAVFMVQCPSCKRQSFLLSIVLSKFEDGENVYDYFRLLNLPTQLSHFETNDIPSEHILLKKTVLEGKYTLEHKQFMSATIMFRRALQILVKDILGAQGKTLYNQLDWLKTNPNLLNINLTDLFHDNSDLIRQVGNQGAHPDDDKDLQEFNDMDAHAVHDLFIALINEVFVMPEKIKKMKEDLTLRRKLK